MPLRPFLPLLLACLLAACAQEPVLDRQAVLDEVLANYRANLVGMRPLAAPPAEGETAPVGAAMPALTGLPAQAAQLLGQPPATVRRLLGEPRLRRREGDAEIWLYQSPFCHLDVMFYGEPGGPAGSRAAPAGLRVTYATARAAGAERRTEAACLQELANQARRS
ncbi:hypothetical protein EBE87_09360 [Pseudoroseomonas wenyumeiae]|uniref:Uncharacterized protein n=3 Tax=Teichococcus wenyumeiae TaxID=2478470 RepID=A0ABX9VN41_9PROT|nr:hypothetical protein EBE87_09360 [Pseudoroseomonas wenyumeiae]